MNAVHSQATDAVARAGRMASVRERYRQAAATIGSSNANALVDLVSEAPILTARMAETSLAVTRPTALRLLRELERTGVLSEGEPGPRGARRYLAHELMAAIGEET